ncbi:CobD/CbiB family cobalamin biosynthesis protein [Candidatus Synechococcus spongiarum]|uniref:CobD/CbiB family cobalamin biosynthesis protein n=1 Tax=Candidatus Synechococcus spongiarum TaxID=431041 RepID=UPI0004AC98DB|nr:CobD/CbiB family cobalamin biosynthesis protein [Candidatus Synechococcus spongiarum]
MSPLTGWGLVLAASALDWLVGDPLAWPHPVQVMGWGISRLRHGLEPWGRQQPRRLQLAGAALAATMVLLAMGAGMALEWGARRWPLLATPWLILAMASCLAGRSLGQRVTAVLERLGPSPDLPAARQALARIVGRDVAHLGRRDILRGAAESASENAVDGAFAPLFWMLVGVGLQAVLGDGAPGPVAMGWGFKAVSTMDSMVGYRQGTLRWLGTAAARLEDGMVWLPCRLAVLSLGVMLGRPWWLLTTARREGAADPSPNASVSMAAYAHAVGVRLGGRNRYGRQERDKPLLGTGHPDPQPASVVAMVHLTRRGLLLWLGLAGVLAC